MRTLIFYNVFFFLLQQASTLADLDSGNMEKVIQDENVTLYVWANLKKNPRYSHGCYYRSEDIGNRLMMTRDLPVAY